MKINKRIVSTTLMLLPLLFVPVLAGTDDGTGICTTLKNIQKILTGISVVVVTLAIMWAGYKFLFTRADISECGKILAAGVMIGSASTIAGWFMGKNATCEVDISSRCVAPMNNVAANPVYIQQDLGIN